MSWKLVLGLTAVLAWAAAPAAAQGKKDTLSVDLPGDAATLDPHVQWDTDSYTIYRNFFDNLLTRDAEGKIVPQVAASWNYVSDTVIDFTIRSDVKFHDGTPLTPEDVVFSVKRITNPAFKSPQLGQFNSIVGAEIVQPNTVRLTTKEPYPALLAQLVKLSIVPKKHVESVGDAKFNLEPMGQRAVPAGELAEGRARRARGERRATGAARRNQARHLPAGAGRGDAHRRLRTGKADIARGLNSDDAAVIKNEAQLQILSCRPSGSATCSSTRCGDPTKDVRVRRAIAYALDRGLIIEALLGGYGRPVDIMLTPANFGYHADIKGYAHDLARAKALVKEAGAEARSCRSSPRRSTTSASCRRSSRCSGEVGLKVTISMSDQATFLRRRQGQPQDAGSLVDRALVLRLPGCRWRDHAAVPQRQHLGEVQQPGL
jgi:peptide/nickel transport system substrate-binding protein